MSSDELRVALERALEGAPEERRLHAAWQVVLAAGARLSGLEMSAGLTLDVVLRRAMGAPASDARRDFALLLLRALGVPGLVRSGVRRERDRAICGFIEAALLNALRRAGYPFGAALYERVRFLESLHATIDEHMRPLEPSIPMWLHGLRRYD